ALGPQIDSLSTFGLDASGRLYAANISSGDVYRIESDGNAATDPRCAPLPPLPSPIPPVVAVQSTPINPGGVTGPAPKLSALSITRGGVVTFRLSGRATVTFTVQRPRSGRAINGRCRPATRSHPKAKRCVIWTAIRASFRITGHRGTNRFVLNR